MVLDGRRVLDGLDLDVPARSTCAVLGPSGCGKTTLLRAIAGLVEADAGTVTVDDRDIGSQSVRDRRIGMAFQEPRLFPNLSVIDNVAYGLRVEGVAKARRRARAGELLTDVGLADRGRERPHGLSGGEQQRVSLARALCGDRDLLLLDEPLSAVDGPARTSLRGLLGDLKATRAMTTVLVTHDLSDATALGDLIAVMGEGTVLQCDRPAETFARPAVPEVASLTGNPNVIVSHAHRGVVQVGAVDIEVAVDDGPVRWTVRPEHLRIGDRDGEPARVVRVERRADRAWLGLVGTLGPLEAVVPAEHTLRPGDMVSVGVDPGSVWVFPEAASRGQSPSLIEQDAR